MIEERTAVRGDRWRSLGTDVELLTSGAGISRHETAMQWMRDELDAVDLACSRFREDSELSAVNRRAGRWTPVSPRFVQLLAESLRIAALTDGLVTPTLGRPLGVLGYDRDLALVRLSGGEQRGSVRRADVTARRLTRARDWAEIELDHDRVRIPRHVALDLGSIGKAAAADRIAAGLGASILSGVDALVNLGGDIAVHAGRKTADPMRWQISLDESGYDEDVRSRAAVRIGAGGLATSSTAVRTWSQHGVRRHHIIDPRTGLPASAHWRCVSVHAADAAEANAASTAAVVLGEAAIGWLQRRGLSARLVASDGSVSYTAGWPADPDIDTVRTAR